MCAFSVIQVRVTSAWMVKENISIQAGKRLTSKSHIQNLQKRLITCPEKRPDFCYKYVCTGMHIMMHIWALGFRNYPGIKIISLSMPNKGFMNRLTYSCSLSTTFRYPLKKGEASSSVYNYLYRK